MPDKVNYSIVHAAGGNIAVQSTVKSFNLDHVTQKDILSFYTAFSQYAAWDTGLLPVQGSGILSIRTAGIYTQFAYQHQPGLYHVNWAAHEGGTASSYYVAQPYRIIICDMKEGNLLGARMFYSPYPITYPTQPLYHVNLPNINCKGYRGNGVGWICLYQNEQWSHLPLNERIVRFIERCSGVETYNDANMSETDGTRFYQENNKPEYLWNPLEWQKRSADLGFEWTLDENLWIPVLVQDMDNQDKHYENGKPLTFADALVGDYKAYYYDDETTKPINAIIRPDKTLSESKVLSIFSQSYILSNSKNSLLDNTFDSSVKVKDQTGSVQFTGSSLLNAPESHVDAEEVPSCYNCEDQDASDEYQDANGSLYCHSCFNEYVVYVKNSGYYHIEDSNIYYHDDTSDYYHCQHDTIVDCDSCSYVFCAHGTVKPENVPGIYSYEGSHFCLECIKDVVNENENVQNIECTHCGSFIPHLADNCPTYISSKAYFPYLQFEEIAGEFISQPVFQNIYLCNSCATSDPVKNYICPCGYIKPSSSEDFSPCISTNYSINDETSMSVTSCCHDCQKFKDGEVAGMYYPKDINIVKNYYESIDYTVTEVHIGTELSQINDIF